MRSYSRSLKTALAATLVPVMLVSVHLLSANSAAQRDMSATHRRLAQEVRHQLLLLPYYTVFDNLEYAVQGIDTVTVSYTHLTLPTNREV